MSTPSRRDRPFRSAIAVCAILLATAVVVVPSTANAQEKSVAEFARLAQKARGEGTVRVIVRLDVPDIQALAAASARFALPVARASVVREQMAADAGLKHGIARAAERMKADLLGADYEVNEIFEFIPYASLRVSRAALAALEASPVVTAIEEDVPMGFGEPVPDTGAKGGAELTDTTEIFGPELAQSTVLIGAKNAWAMGYTGSGWYVAILDTGIRKTHQFFTGKTVREACYAMGRDGATGAGDCPGGVSQKVGAGAAVHYSSGYEGYDHGTHVSGIAAGRYGTKAGVAKYANIIAVQIFSRFTAGDCGGAPCVMSWNTDQLRGLQHVYSLRNTIKIAAVNMSLGGGQHPTYCSGVQKSAIDQLRAVKIATVIATGNDGWCGYTGAPACISSAVAVGASTKTDQEASFNNWHATIQKLFAPGVSINSSTGGSNASYQNWNGTSMATPHVTGAWALMRQKYPTWTVSQIQSKLRSKGKPLSSPCGSTRIPRIKVDSALQ